MAEVKILKDNCKCCGFCVDVCRKNVLSVGKELNVQGYHYVIVEKPSRCIGCMMCAIMCPDGAIEVYR